LATVKTAPEFIEKQAAFAKASFDGFMKQATQFNELFMAAAKDVVEPLNARANVAADMAKTYRA
jgi:phasin family protein